MNIVLANLRVFSVPVYSLNSSGWIFLLTLMSYISSEYLGKHVCIGMWFLFITKTEFT